LKSFLISSERETARKANVDLLLSQLPDTEIVDSVYPDHQHIPFLNKIKTFSKQRTGHALLNGEIGCLLSHRKAWQKIVAEKNEHEFYLILESDSIINDLPCLLNIVNNKISIYKSKAFIFFFGAWLGHMKLYRSSSQAIDENYTIGEPFIKTVYCSYGYGINRQAAEYLLQQTKIVAYPVDQFKRIIDPAKISILGVQPEIIGTAELGSYINQSSIRIWQRKFIMNLLDMKNNFICYFK